GVPVMGFEDTPGGVRVRGRGVSVARDEAEAGGAAVGFEEGAGHIILPRGAGSVHGGAEDVHVISPTGNPPAAALSAATTAPVNDNAARREAGRRWAARRRVAVTSESSGCR